MKKGHSLKLSRPFCPSQCGLSIIVVGNQIADSARWADVSIAAMSVRRLSGSAWAALSGPGIYRGVAGNMDDKVLHCRIRLWLMV